MDRGWACHDAAGPSSPLFLTYRTRPFFYLTCMLHLCAPFARRFVHAAASAASESVLHMHESPHVPPCGHMR